MHEEKFENFLRTFGAVRMLLEKAHKNGALLEGLVLYAAIIDGLCRIALVLHEQIKNKSMEIYSNYISQDNDNTYYSERQIFNLTLSKNIIGKQLHSEISALYDVRNKAIHRFFLSEIEYWHLELALSRYEKVYTELFQIVYDLESRQIEQKVGMTISKKYTEKEKIAVKKDVLLKIKSGDEKKLARTFNAVSVQEIVEFASKNGLLDECSCTHTKGEHIDIRKPKQPDETLDDRINKCGVRKCNCVRYIPRKNKE